MRRRSSGALLAGALLLAGCGAGSDAEVAGSDAAPPSTDDADETADEGDAADDADEPADDPDTSSSAEAGWFGDHLSVGDCWDDTVDDDGDYLYTGVPQIVDCAETHDNEVIAVWAIEGAPDDDALDERADTVCSDAWVRYVGAEYDSSALEGFAIWPTPEELEAGGRQGVCSVYLPGARLRGSQEGIGRLVRPHDLPADSPIPPSAVLQRAGINDDGDRVLAFEIETAPDDTLTAILRATEDAGWEVTGQGGASRTVVLELNDGADEYTVTVTAPDEADELVTIAYFYPPDEG